MNLSANPDKSFVAAEEKNGELVIIRHGKSEANANNMFAGWVDTPLVTLGKEQAHAAGETLRKTGFVPDAVFSSPQSRALDTARIALAAMGLPHSEIIQDAALMERHYGGLTGMNKTQAEQKFGSEMFLTYRRSYDEPPPPMDSTHPFHPENKSVGMKVVAMPPNGKGTESLKDVVDRVRPFWEKEIFPHMRKGEKILIAAHGNSLRALSMIIESMTPDQVKGYEIENGVPIKYAIRIPEGAKDWTFTREILNG